MEITIAKMWSEVIAVPIHEISSSTSFYEVGGTSLDAVRLSVALAKAGITLHAGKLRDNPTIAQQASIAVHEMKEGAKITTTTNIAQGEVTGSVPFSTSQLSSLQRLLPWDSSTVVLSALATIDLKSLKSALSALVSHHDMLRVSFEVDGKPTTDYKNCTQRIRSVTEMGTLNIVQVETLPITDAQRRLKAKIMETNVPIAVTVLNSDLLSPTTDKCVIITVHPLVVDSRSWQILLADLHTLYTGGTLQQKTVSYQDWAVEHSLTIPDPNARLADGAGEWGWVDISLPAEYTRNMLKNATVDREPQHLILTAYFLAFHNIFGVNELSADVELPGYGRGNGLQASGLSRTIGHFSSPASVALNYQPTFSRLLLHVRKAIENYSPVRSDVSLVFRYFGNMDIASNKHWKVSLENSLDWLTTIPTVSCSLYAFSALSEHKLIMGFKFNKALLTEEVAQRVAQSWREQFELLVSYSQNSSLVVLKYPSESFSEHIPVIFIHGAGGSLMPFISLLPHLPRPAVGFRCNKPPTSIEDLAYAHELLELFPEGPYIVCGYSFGAIVALEMGLVLKSMQKAPLAIISLDHPFTVDLSERIPIFEHMDEHRMGILGRSLSLLYQYKSRASLFSSEGHKLILIRALQGSMPPDHFEFDRIVEVPGNHLTMMHEQHARPLGATIHSEICNLLKTKER